jgi:hypothetical protein
MSDNLVLSLLLRSLLLYLESSPEPEDAVIGLLWWQPLQSQLHSIVLFWNQVIASVHRQSLRCHQALVCAREKLLQSKLPVPLSIGIPFGDWLCPPQQPRTLSDEWGERRLRHDGGQIGDQDCICS